MFLEKISSMFTILNEKLRHLLKVGFILMYTHSTVGMEFWFFTMTVLNPAW